MIKYYEIPKNFCPFCDEYGTLHPSRVAGPAKRKSDFECDHNEFRLSETKV